ncbi:MAG: transposase [Nitrospirota bacterium]
MKIMETEGGFSNPPNGGQECQTNGGQECQTNGGQECQTNGGQECQTNGGQECQTNGGQECQTNGGQECQTNGGQECQTNGGQECQTNGGQECQTNGGQECQTNGGQECQTNGGQECPPSVPPSCFFNPFVEIEQHKHRLPHWQQGDILYFVTWRLADALPKQLLEQLLNEKEIWLKNNPKPWDNTTEEEYHDRFTHRVDQWLDAGSGSCVLQTPKLARIVASALRHFDGERYDMVSFVVMPNHIHTLFYLRHGYRLQDVIKSWKGYTAREINKSLSVKGAFWQEDYWDRMIRNERHFKKCWDYIRMNPLKARLGNKEYVYYTTEGGFSNPPLNDGQKYQTK